jgi:hypothetical protein
VTGSKPEKARTDSNPGEAEPAGQDSSPQGAPNYTHHLAQSPFFAVKALFINGLVCLCLTGIICLLPLFLFYKITGISAWDFVRDYAGTDTMSWFGYGSLIVLTLTFLIALYALRGLSRMLILPILRGGFRGGPCLFADSEGFIDTRILRDTVRWETIENRKGWGIGDHNTLGVHVIDIFLKKSARVRKRHGNGTAMVVLVLAGPFDWRNPPYDLLAQHYKAWRRGQEVDTKITDDGSKR